MSAVGSSLEKESWKVEEEVKGNEDSSLSCDQSSSTSLSIKSQSMISAASAVLSQLTSETYK